MAAFTTEQRLVFEEATRVIPGLLACKARGGHKDSRVLIDGLLAFGWEQGFPHCMTWSIMFSAALHWFTQASYSLAKHEGVTLEQLASSMAMIAAQWETDAV